MPETITDQQAVSEGRSVRAAVGRGLSRLAKVFGTAVPADIAAAEVASGMDAATPFSPGAPLSPYDGYSRTPRTQNYVPQYNVSARPRSHERVAFSTLQGLIEAYDIAQIAIWHRIDSIRALEWSLVAADGYEGDVTSAVALGMAALAKPDRKKPFSTWLGEYLYDVLAYDAGALYRMRNRSGATVGLKVVDGTTIAPLLNDWGDEPEAPAPAYVQYVNGLPWNWLTADDLIYRPFRKISGSPYGRAPLESILLNANTDLRFQAYFLQRFTEGNIPEAFASAPESWTPDQIEQFQQSWDALMLGDQDIKSQIKWIPGGGRIEWSNEKDFSDAFSLHLLRKTFAAYHVVPSDAGFTQEVNKSSGESQSDVQHRLGDVPLAKHVSGVLTAHLQEDLGLPLQHKFDFGEEQDDRYQTAQADDLYIKNGTVSPSEIRELRFGLAEPAGRPVPRFVYTTRGGPIPLSAINAVAGPVDPTTAAPEPTAELSHDAFRPIEGVVPVPALPSPPLAEQIYGPSAVDDPQSVGGKAQPLGKDGAPTAGITSATGITGYDLIGQHDEDEDDEPAGASPEIAKAAEVRASELAAFRRYAKQRRRLNRPWRDFEFAALDPVAAHRLNDTGRLAVRKAAGQVAVAGLAVHAADTGRVLMLQRALDDDDPAAGTWEFPGGHLEDGESPLVAALREWSEETGCQPPDGEQGQSWTSGDGVYQGIVWRIATEAQVPVFEDRDQVTNPDDPDGDQVEALAWWDPAQLPGNPAVRPELLESIGDVLAALGPDLAKAAGGSHPKARAPEQGPVQKVWPGWARDQETAAAWKPKIRAAMSSALDTGQIARWFLDAQPVRKDEADDDTPDPTDWAAQNPDLLAALIGVLGGLFIGLWTEGYAIGELSATALLSGQASVDWSAWEPGDAAAARLVLGPDGENGLQLLLDQAGISIKSIAANRMDKLARALADALARGDSADTLARALRGILDDPQWAYMVAVTELNRATSQASLDTYGRNGIAAKLWLSADDDRVCTLICEANEAEGPIPLRAAFQSSDDAPPGHVLCRCAIGPYLAASSEVGLGDATGDETEP